MKKIVVENIQGNLQGTEYSLWRSNCLQVFHRVSNMKSSTKFVEKHLLQSLFFNWFAGLHLFFQGKNSPYLNYFKIQYFYL